MSAVEVNAGTPFPMTFTLEDESGTLTDSTAMTVVIQPGFGNAPITLSLINLTHVSTGVYSYEYDTTGVATAATGPVEHTVQCQSTGGIKCTSDPASFVVEPPSLAGLT